MITLHQALKKKNKLVAELKALYAIIENQNSLEESAPRHYIIKDVLAEINTKINELVELKTKIHIANTPKYSEIFLISELKGFIKQLKAMPVAEGKVSGHYGQQSETKTVELNVVDKNKLVDELQETIEKLQDSLDVFNVKTNI